MYAVADQLLCATESVWSPHISRIFRSGRSEMTRCRRQGRCIRGAKLAVKDA
jgi:hypothetical protein